MSNTSDSISEPEDTILDEGAMSAMSDGFRQLDDPAPSKAIEYHVIQELTSGRDFDPWYRQIARRIVWTTAPAVAAFAVVSGVLVLRPIPKISWTHLAIGRIATAELQRRDDVDKLYGRIPAAAALSGFPVSLNSGTPGLIAPAWWKKPTPAPAGRAVKGLPLRPGNMVPTTANSKGEVNHK